MPRKPRYYLPGIPVHIVQRGNNRQAVFFDDRDYRSYLRWLKEGAERYGCAVHGYVLMTSHVHALVTPEKTDSVNKLVQYVGRYYVSYINHEYGRTEFGIPIADYDLAEELETLARLGDK